jgi:hypothetical protein
MGVLSSRRSMKYSENLQAVQNLFQDVNKKFVDHKEKQRETII